MWYRNRRYRYGRRRGWLGFPFMLLFFIVFASHSWSVLIGGIIIIIMFLIIFRAIAAVTRSGNAAPTGQPPYQTPYYQPSQPYQQPPQPYQAYQEPYQAYEQGYQTPTPTYQEPVQEYQPQPQYEEQPQAQYPEELPPMKQ